MARSWQQAAQDFMYHVERPNERGNKGEVGVEAEAER